ncbi:hypothetical protein NFI96_009148 [Prochilodus magdalenae]|nr:hypothetical protein NFI96_009148 [Prochilodus magdalenae]
MVPAVRDVVMNRTFQIISMEFPQFDTSDWMDWFEIKLSPVLPSLTAEMLVTAVYYTNCTNYRVIVSGISGVFSRMTASRREEITKALVRHLKDLAAQLNTPGRYPLCALVLPCPVCRAPHGGGFSDAVAW